jgi:hypothetical protein
VTTSVGTVASYLVRSGWSETGQRWRGAGIWQRDGIEVLLPERDDLGDNTTRLRELLQAVAAVEGRSVIEVARDVERPDRDSVTYVGPDEGLPVPTAAVVVSAMRDLLAVAARTVVEGPHLRFYGALPPSAERVLGRTRLALGEDGAASCTLLVPVQDQGELDGRDVSVALHDTVAAAGVAAAAGASAFDGLAPLGVSPALCAAVADMGAPDRAPFSLRFRWGHARTSALPSRTVDFAPGAAAVLRAAARRLRRTGVSGSARVSGHADGLHDEAGSPDRWRVRVHGSIATAVSRAPRGVIWVRLPSEQAYDVAVQAYRTGRRFSASGELINMHGRIELLVPAGAIDVENDPEDHSAH